MKKFCHNFELERPKSLDRLSGFGQTTSKHLGVLKKFQYYSKEDSLHADDETSDFDEDNRYGRKT